MIFSLFLALKTLFRLGRHRNNQKNAFATLVLNSFAYLNSVVLYRKSEENKIDFPTTAKSYFMKNVAYRKLLWILKIVFCIQN
jgi:hypothetical protein